MTSKDTGEAFIREVDDEYRRARMQSFWNRFGRALLLAIGVGFMAVAGLLYWQETERKKEAAVASDYAATLARLSAGDRAAVAPALAQTAESPNPVYRSLARLLQAETAEGAEAAKALDSIVADDKASPPMRDLARLKALQLRFDSLPPAQAVEQLRPLAQPGGPWFGTAGELTAIAYLRMDRPELAAPILRAIVADQAIPITIRARAEQLLNLPGMPPAAPGAAAARSVPAASPAPASSGALAN